MTRLNDKIAVITGGNSGIGLETARRFVAEGARVVLFGRDRATLDAAVTELGDAAAGVQGDVTKGADLDRLFAETAKRFGRIDVLFVNAGIAQPRPFDAADEAHFDVHFDVNVKGAYFTVQKALPHLSEGASVVLTTSAVDRKGMAGMTVYAATKAALRSLARSLSAELGPRGIRVNTVAPGPIETPIFGRMEVTDAEREGMGAAILESTPAGRFGAPEEIAHAVVFLASDESSFMLGSELAVDGGFAQL